MGLEPVPVLLWDPFAARHLMRIRVRVKVRVRSGGFRNGVRVRVNLGEGLEPHAALHLRGTRNGGAQGCAPELGARG